MRQARDQHTPGPPRVPTPGARARCAAPGRPREPRDVPAFGGALNLNVHFHTIVPDGVWTEADDGTVAHHPLPAPSAAELEALTATIATRVTCLLVRRGLWLEDDEGGRPADVDELPVLASIYEASVTQRGETGAPLRRIGATMTLEPGTLVAAERRAHGGFDLHAGVVVRAGDRERLEHLCRYLLRPPLANDRLQQLDSGDVLLKLKTRWSDGTTHLRLSPTELLDRLCALIPRPRTNLVLYHGVFAANAKWRSRIVPPPRPEPARHPPSGADRPNHDWAELMRRGLDIDSLECPKKCGRGRLEFVACIDRPAVIRRILVHLGLPAEPVRTTPARAPPSPRPRRADGTACRLSPERRLPSRRPVRRASPSRRRAGASTSPIDHQAPPTKGVVLCSGEVDHSEPRPRRSSKLVETTVDAEPG